MTINKKIITATISTILAISAVIPAIAFAQSVSSSTAGARAEARQERVSAAEQKRLVDFQSKAGAEIDQRVSDLTTLLTKIQSIRNLQDSQKTPIINVVQGLIVSLTDLKSKISSESSTTALRAEVQSITQGFRVYALVLPQLHIISTADSASTVVQMLNGVGAKLQARLMQDAKSNADKTVQAAMTDLALKINDAQKQSQAAVDEITPLMPDNGDKAKFQSNLAALKDAKAKIQSAKKDIEAGRKDIQTITKVLAKNAKAAGITASSTTATTTGQ